MSRLDLYFEEDGDGEHDVYELRIDGVTVASRVIETEEDRAVEERCREMRGGARGHLVADFRPQAALLFPEFAAEHPEIIPRDAGLP